MIINKLFLKLAKFAVTIKLIALLHGANRTYCICIFASGRSKCRRSAETRPKLYICEPFGALCSTAAFSTAGITYARKAWFEPARLQDLRATWIHLSSSMRAFVVYTGAV
jgi:hypothetical protein